VLGFLFRIQNVLSLILDLVTGHWTWIFIILLMPSRQIHFTNIILSPHFVFGRTHYTKPLFYSTIGPVEHSVQNAAKSFRAKVNSATDRPQDSNHAWQDECPFRDTPLQLLFRSLNLCVLFRFGSVCVRAPTHNKGLNYRDEQWQ